MTIQQLPVKKTGGPTPTGIEIARMAAVATGAEAPASRAWQPFEDAIDATIVRTTEYAIRRACPDAPEHPRVNAEPLATFRSDGDTTEQLTLADV
jgi:hypothetical protein